MVLALGGESNERGEFADERKDEIYIIHNGRVTFVKVDYMEEFANRIISGLGRFAKRHQKDIRKFLLRPVARCSEYLIERMNRGD